MKLEILLNKLEFEAQKADRDWKEWKQTRLDLVQQLAVKPPTVTEATRDKVRNLRAKTETIYEEMYQRKLLQLADAEHIKARIALHEAYLTPSERAARDEEVREFQIRLSRVTSPEQHPNWREHATLAFRNKKL
jgi:hypothetical protein